MNEEFLPGSYTATENLNIRAAMHTGATVLGGYRNGDPFTVYQVYPERSGIVWGRVSSNEGSGTARYVALRVNKNMKVKMEKAADQEQIPIPIPSTALMAWAKSVDAWARLNGYKGPTPHG